LGVDALFTFPFTNCLVEAEWKTPEKVKDFAESLLLRDSKDDVKFKEFATYIEKMQLDNTHPDIGYFNDSIFYLINKLLMLVFNPNLKKSILKSTVAQKSDKTKGNTFKKPSVEASPKKASPKKASPKKETSSSQVIQKEKSPKRVSNQNTEQTKQPTVNFLKSQEFPIVTHKEPKEQYIQKSMSKQNSLKKPTVNDDIDNQKHNRNISEIIKNNKSTKNDQNLSYNDYSKKMPKAPLYLGVFADSSEKYLNKLEDDILDLTIDVLYDLKQQYPLDKLIGDDLQNLKDFRDRKSSTWK